MPAGPVTVPAGNLESILDGTVALEGGFLKVALFSSAWSTATRFYSTTNELATANGYTQGGIALASVTVVEAGGVAVLDAADATWTATGGSISARYAVIYDDADVSNTIVGYVLLDTTPLDVTATDGNSFTITWDATGILRLSQA